MHKAIRIQPGEDIVMGWGAIAVVIARTIVIVIGGKGSLHHLGTKVGGVDPTGGFEPSWTKGVVVVTAQMLQSLALAIIPIVICHGCNE